MIVVYGLAVMKCIAGVHVCLHFLLQLLLDWCTHALTGWYSRKVEFSQNVLEGLWCYLDDLLHSRKLCSLLKQGKTISLRLNMAQVGNTEIKQDGKIELCWRGNAGCQLMPLGLFAHNPALKERFGIKVLY